MEDSFFPSVPTSWKRTRNEIHHLQSFEINQQLKDARDSRRILAGFLSCLLRCWGGERILRTIGTGALASFA